MAGREVYRVEIPIIIADQTDKPLQQAERKINRFEKSALKSNERIRRIFGREIKVKISAVDKAWPVIRSVQTRLRSLTSRTWNVTLQAKDKVSGFLKGLVNKLTSPLALLGAGAGLGAGILYPLKLAGEFEQARMSLDFYMGSVEEGERAFQDLIRFAKDTPFEFRFLQDMMIQLMGAGYNFEQAKRALTAFGDAAGRTGAGMEGIANAMLGFTQIASTGKLTLQDLRQIALSLRIPLSIFAKELGIAESELGNVGEAGISSEKAMEAIIRTLEQRFAGGLKELSNSLLGMISVIKDTANLTVWFFGKGMAEPVKRIMFDIIGLTDETGGKFEEFQRKLERVGEQVGLKFEQAYGRIKEFWNNLSADPEFQKLDFGDKLIYILNLALDKIDAWLDGEGGQRLQETFSKIGGIIAKAWYKGMTSLGERTTQELKEGDIKGALVPAAIMWMMGGGALAKGAWGLGKGLFGAGKWAFGKILPKTTSTAAKAAATVAETAATTSAASATGTKIIYGPTGEVLKTIVPAAEKAASTAGTTSKTLTMLSKFGKVANKVAVPLAIAGEIYSVVTSKDKIRAAIQGAVGLAGGWGGAKLGAAIGTAIAPGIGTVIGGALFSLGGYLLGRFLGGKTVDIAREGTIPVDTQQTSQMQIVIEVKAESSPTYHIKTATDAKEVLRIIRENEKIIADQLADDIARNLVGVFNNMPAYAR